MDSKLIKIKVWNITHAKCVSFKRTDSKVKLGTLCFNNMKNAEARHEALEDIHVMDNFMVGNETQNVNDYLLALVAEDMTLFAAVEQGSRKMSTSLIVIVVPKAKLAARKWMFTICGKEVTATDKIERFTTFSPHDYPAKQNAQKILKYF